MSHALLKQICRTPNTPTRWVHFAVFTIIGLAVSSQAAALEAGKDEKAMLSSCERQLCRQILDKAPRRGRLKCDLGKTWVEKDINKGAKSKSISWGFGDAQCKVQLNLKRQHIINALSAPKYEFTARRHDVNCIVETSEGTKPLKASLAPKFKFEGGRAKKVWVQLKDIDGPEPLSSFVWTTAKLEASLGIFHSAMIKQINKFAHEKCERQYGKKALARKKRRRLRKQRREARERRQAILAKRRKAKAAQRARNKALREQRQKARLEKRGQKQPASKRNKPPANDGSSASAASEKQ
ncbi:MAG: hypothetical protein K0U74_12985 [Alphaproteobacteria bacterium]|nr:hypothetical protein [Alphaproteobacteria bacterium]